MSRNDFALFFSRYNSKSIDIHLRKGDWVPGALTEIETPKASYLLP